MVDPALTYSLLPLSIGLVCLCLGVYVLARSDDQRISQAFMISMCMVLIFCAAQFLLANAPEGQSAESFGRVMYFTGVLVFTSFLYLALDLVFDSKKKRILERKYQSIAVILAMASASAVIAGPFASGYFGYWPEPSYSLLAWLVMLGVLSVIPLVMLIGLSDRSNDNITQQRASLVTLGVIVPFLLVCFDMFMVWSGIEIVHLTPLGMLLSAVIFALEIRSNPRSLSKPVELIVESEPTKEMNIKLVPGRCNLVKSKKVDLSYRMFVSEIAAGNKGLLITRVHPDQIRERYGLVKTPILWLSGQPGPDRLDPASLSIVQHTMIDFLQKSPQSIILLDGLEYLATENQVDKVLRLIYSVHDAVVITGSKLIVPIDPNIMTTKDMAFFEREFFVIEDVTPGTSGID